jgi:hypothetical protein
MLRINPDKLDKVGVRVGIELGGAGPCARATPATGRESICLVSHPDAVACPTALPALQVEQDQLWAQSGVDQPTMLQHNDSPLTDGHPRHVNNEGEEGGQQEEEAQASGGGGNSTTAVLSERLEAVQHQLEQQGQLLRTLCAHLEARHEP